MKRLFVHVVVIFFFWLKHSHAVPFDSKLTEEELRTYKQVNKEIERFSTQVQHIYDGFNQVLINGNETVFPQLKTEINQAKHDGALALLDIQTLLTILDARFFEVRLEMELHRIHTEQLLKMLKTIQLEIVGHELSLTQFEQYVKPDTITAPRAKLHSQLHSLTNQLDADDKLIQQFFQNSTKSASDNMIAHLNSTEAAIIKTRNDAADGYYHQLEITHLRGKDVDLWLKLEVDMLLAACNVCSEFINKFKLVLQNSVK